MNLRSSYVDLGSVTLPPYRGRQRYMHSFDTDAYTMEDGFEDYGAPVRHLCEAAGYVGVVHMTVDEKVVDVGMSQRRPGAHVDGRFLPDAGIWGHDPGPVWAHYCNHVPMDRMSIIVASSVPGCRVYPGEFVGHPQSDGDLEHIRDQLGEGELLDAGRGYWLSPDCVHESLRFDVPTKRIFLRLALEDW